MKRLILVAVLLPLTAFAQPINTLNNPNLPGYQNPTQQRMQTQMLNQQQQQKLKLNQSVQTQSRLQQQHLEAQINNNSQRVKRSQPGELDAGKQMLPNNNGSMLNQRQNSDSTLMQQQHTLPRKQTNGMLNQTTISTPQANIPLKTVTP
ncbi:DUF2756 family protein [Phytobacter sp. V91]|uniref:DUF2756 family protein n=1 Tax=Phytobacter sp. V91 TaxID=3369425 RepID=UPI003F60B51A